MTTFIVRYYGRFVLARERQNGKFTGSVKFLAPTLESPPEIGRHQPILTIDRRRVSNDPLRSSVPPTLRAIPGLQKEAGEYLLWDLTQIAVEIPAMAQNSFALNESEKSPLPDLVELENAAGNKDAELDLVHLEPGAKVGATVSMSSGIAEASFVAPSPTKFIAESTARAGRSDDVPTIFTGATIASWIEVAVPVPEIITAGGKLGVMGLHMRGRQNGSVLIQGPDQTQINFSNLCASCPRGDRDFDVEFGQYYELLKSPRPNRLIPFGAHAGQDECNDPAQVCYDI